jgi:putative hydrolase of the HAD superfamily
MSDRPTIAAALFDAGGTLVRLDFEWMAESIRSLGHEIAAGSLRRAEVQGRLRFDASDRATILPYFEGTLEAAGVPQPLVPAVLETWSERQRAVGLWVKPMEGAREALEGVRAAGLRVAVISNSDGRAEQHIVDCGLRDQVEFVVDSGLVGVEKPDPRIFRLALERMGVPPGQAVYVGDVRSVDRHGAEGAGLHFILVDGTGTYGREDERRVGEMVRLPALMAGWFRLPSVDLNLNGGAAWS